jgi:hypothetical protein
VDDEDTEREVARRIEALFIYLPICSKTSSTISQSCNHSPSFPSRMRRTHLRIYPLRASTWGARDNSTVDALSIAICSLLGLYNILDRYSRYLRTSTYVRK